MKPFLFGQTYYRTDPLIDRFLTSMTLTGSLSLLYIGRQIYSTVNIVIAKAITNPTVPNLAIAPKSGDWTRFKRIYYERLLWMAGLTAMCFLGLLVFGEPLLHLMIGRGGITAQNVRTLWLIMIVLIGLMAGGTVGQVITTAFYVIGDTKTPTRIFNLVYTIYIPIKVLVFFRSGLIGMAIATSVHLIVIFLVQFLILEKTLASGKCGSLVFRLRAARSENG